MSYLLQSRIQCRAASIASSIRATSIRSFTVSRKAMVQASEISPSQGESIDTLVSQTTALVDSGRWTLCNNGKGLERQFKFRTFKATWVFQLCLASTLEAAANLSARTS
jgi:4a-hydroxytetrahydrobiopterin dehydratase